MKKVREMKGTDESGNAENHKDTEGGEGFTQMLYVILEWYRNMKDMKK